MATRESRDFRPAERAYDLDRDHLPVYVGEGLGSLEYKDAIDLSIIYRTALDLPATKEYISAIKPPPKRHGREWTASQTSRASKNNPYICVHCGYKTTRYANMLTHLKNAHGDNYTDPRDNH